jgi:hypothetical protein
MIILNPLGFFALLLFSGLFIAGHFLLGLLTPPSRELDRLLLCVACSACALLDLGFRCFGTTGRGLLPYLQPSRGGHLFFIPVWLLALAIVFGVVGHSARPALRAGPAATAQPSAPSMPPVVEKTGVRGAQSTRPHQARH